MGELTLTCVAYLGHERGNGSCSTQAGHGLSLESDTLEWEMVEPGESLSEFIEHVMEDQEEGLQLYHQSSQVLVSLLLLVERADTYRARLGTEVERGELLEQGLTQLEDACERVRRFVEGTEPSEHEDGAVMTVDHPIELGCSWGEVEMVQSVEESNDGEELKMIIEDFVLALGEFWDDMSLYFNV